MQWGRRRRLAIADLHIHDHAGPAPDQPVAEPEPLADGLADGLAERE
ncbi:MAG: hypothetical protein M3N53_01335 [Actinomycetota bacterium]|nr:hypothetical protein [Actinomycetota bacterium]